MVENKNKIEESQATQIMRGVFTGMKTTLLNSIIGDENTANRERIPGTGVEVSLEEFLC